MSEPVCYGLDMKTLQERHDQILKELVAARSYEVLVLGAMYQLEYAGEAPDPRLLYTFQQNVEDAQRGTRVATNKLLAFTIINNW